MAATIAPAGWVASATATAATATATQAAPTAPAGGSPKVLVIFGVDASFSATPAAPVLLQVRDGASVIWSDYIGQNYQRQFQRGIRVTAGNAASAVLASGGASVIGWVNLDGATI